VNVPLRGTPERPRANGEKKKGRERERGKKREEKRKRKKGKSEKNKKIRGNPRPARAICIMHRGGRSPKWILVKDGQKQVALPRNYDR
jgi:hypothetical protein